MLSERRETKLALADFAENAEARKRPEEPVEGALVGTRDSRQLSAGPGTLGEEVCHTRCEVGIEGCAGDAGSLLGGEEFRDSGTPGRAA